VNPEYRLYWALRRRLAERSRRRVRAVLRYWLGGIVIG
jgi:hypothetical protein